jgi:hypothetical protein
MSENHFTQPFARLSREWSRHAATGVAAFAAVVAFGLVSSRLTAQPIVQSDDRVRVSAGRQHYIGRLAVASRDSLVVVVDNAYPVRLLAARITRVDLSEGRTTPFNIARGIGIGAALGVMAGFVTSSGDNGSALNAGFIAAGAVVGAIAGSVLSGDRWVPARLPP